MIPADYEFLVAFVSNTVWTPHEDGRVDIDCKRGLWGVSAPDEEQAISEAVHYFQQYYHDGEYASHPAETVEP